MQIVSAVNYSLYYIQFGFLFLSLLLLKLFSLISLFIISGNPNSALGVSLLSSLGCRRAVGPHAPPRSGAFNRAVDGSLAPFVSRWDLGPPQPAELTPDNALGTYFCAETDTFSFNEYGSRRVEAARSLLRGSRD